MPPPRLLFYWYRLVEEILIVLGSEIILCTGLAAERSTVRNLLKIVQTTGNAPGIVDADRNPIIDRSEMYSGVKGRASINLYAYNVNGNRGIACGLNNLQKISDGTPLGGKSRAEDDFATEDDEDFLN